MARRIRGGGGFQVDSQYGSMIILSLVLVIIFSLGLLTDVPDTKQYMQGKGVDIFPTLTDLNPNMPTAKYDTIPSSNYQFIFEDLDFSFSNAGRLMAGICANFIFSFAVAIGQLSSLIINISMQSDYVPSMLGRFVDAIGTGSFIDAILWLIPFTYGAWAMWTGFTTKRYATALLGVLGALMLYATGTWIMDKPAEIMKSVSTASSQIGASLASAGVTHDSKANVPAERIMADNIWAAQVYIPWSIIQFKDPGFTDFSNRYDDSGNLKLTIPPIGSESVNNWAEKLLKQNGPLSSKELEEIQKVLYDNDDNLKHQVDPTTAFMASFVVLSVNLFNFIVISLSGISALAMDFFLFGLLIVTPIVFIVSLFPAIGRRIYKTYASLAISIFVIKAVLMLIIGIQVKVMIMTYLDQIASSSNPAASLLLGGFLSIMGTVIIMAIAFIVWKATKGHAPAMLANAALGRFDRVEEEIKEWKGEGGLGIKDALAATVAKANPAIAKNLFGADMDRLIQKQLNKAELMGARANELMKGGDIEGGMALHEKAADQLQSAGDMAKQIQSKTGDVKDYNKYQNLSKRSVEIMGSMQRQKLATLASAYDENMKLAKDDPTKQLAVKDQYLSDLESVREEAIGIIDSPSADGKAVGIATDVYNQVLKTKNDMALDDIKFMNKSLNDREYRATDLASQVAAGTLTQSEMDETLKQEFGNLNPALVTSNLNSFIKNARNDMEIARDEKTVKILEGYINQADSMRKAIFDSEFRKVADHDKLTFLEDALRDNNLADSTDMHHYIQDKMQSTRHELMNKHAASIPSNEKFDYWKNQLDGELTKPSDMRNNATIDFLRNKFQDEYIGKIETDYNGFVSFADTDQNARVKEQLNDLIENVGATGSARERAEAIKEDIIAREAIFGNVNADWDTQLDVLRGLMDNTKYTMAADLLNERLSEVLANKFNEDVTNISNMIHLNAGGLNEQTLATIADAVSKMEVPHIDMSKLADHVMDGHVQDVQDFTNALEKFIVEERKAIPAWDVMNDALVRQESITHEAVAAMKHRLENQSGYATSNHELETYLKDLQSRTEGELKSMVKLLEQSLHGNKSGEVSRTVEGFRTQLANAITNTEGELRQELAKRIHLMDEISEEVYRIAREGEGGELWIGESKEK